MPPPPEDEYSKTINFMPPYILPRCTNTPKVKIPKKTGAPLIATFVPKGVKLLMDIMSNLRKLSFVDHDTKNQRDLNHKNYMDTIQDTHEAPKRLVANEWARALE